MVQPASENETEILQVDNNTVMSYPSDISIFPFLLSLFQMIWRCLFRFSFSLYVYLLYSLFSLFLWCLSIPSAFVCKSIYNEHIEQVKNEFSSQKARDSRIAADVVVQHTLFILLQQQSNILQSDIRNWLNKQPKEKQTAK